MLEKPYLEFLGLPLSPVVPVALRCETHLSADTHRLFIIMAEKRWIFLIILCTCTVSHHWGWCAAGRGECRHPREVRGAGLGVLGRDQLCSSKARPPAHPHGPLGRAFLNRHWAIGLWWTVLVFGRMWCFNVVNAARKTWKNYFFFNHFFFLWKSSST